MKRSYTIFKYLLVYSFFSLISYSIPLVAQVSNSPEKGNDPSEGASDNSPKVVRVTGVRFAYPLIQQWIDDFNKEYKNIRVIIESRGTTDPSKYDVLVEAYNPEPGAEKTRAYVYVARYGVVPIANSKSDFARVFSEKGLNGDQIKQVYFNDIFADKDKNLKIPYTVYTRLQKAGSPLVFANYFGFEQKDFKGNAIAGADEHLLKAVIRDTTAVSYLPISIAYDARANAPVDGISVIPVDLNGNGKVQDDEKFYSTLDGVLDKLETSRPRDIKNLPVEYLNLSINKNSTSPEAVEFLLWISQNGEKYLRQYGFIKPEADAGRNEHFLSFAAQKQNENQN